MSKISKPKTIDYSVAKSVTNTLTIISRDPYYESLNEIIQALYANAATLPTILEGEKYVHVGIITKDTL